ncbi:MAG: methyltransferase regulatory domain-containing protein [Bryobacterales bacterium]|nr:methyltransferase regulatory domain-containing protein [Bryobacterales bacterium]
MPSDYNKQLYPTRAQPQLHIDNLYATARLSGFQPAEVQRARVLEVGCGDAMNLIPMACALPEAEFVGVDYASAPVDAAKEMIGALGISNVRVHHADICELADDFGEFDYIIAHGFYSWAPDAAREALWRVAQGSLAAKGLLFVSYNLLPGWRQTAMLRDFVVLEGRRYGDDPDGPRKVWQAVTLLASLEGLAHPLASEAARSMAKGLETAIHDEFQPETRPFLFREVLDAAAAHGLAYLGDAVRKMRGGLQAEPRVARMLAEATQNDPLLYEEYADIMTLRRFRQSTFMRASQRPDSRSFAERTDDLFLRSLLRMGEPDSSGQRPFEADDNDLRLTADDPVLIALCHRLAGQANGSLPVGETIRGLVAGHPEWDSEVQREFWELFEELSKLGGFAFSPRQLSVADESVFGAAACPRVGQLSRLEAARNRDITTPSHTVLPLHDPLHRAFLVLLDGTRTMQQMVETIALAAWQQHTAMMPTADVGGTRLPLLDSGAFQQQPAALESPQSLRRFLSALAPAELERFRNWGLMEGTGPQAQ